jgi:hypothetical protein
MFKLHSSILLSRRALAMIFIRAFSSLVLIGVYGTLDSWRASGISTISNQSIDWDELLHTSTIPALEGCAADGDGGVL